MRHARSASTTGRFTVEHHRTEIENAKREARALPGQIDELATELSELPKEVEAARLAREQTVRLDEAVRRGEPERVEQALLADACARGTAAAHQPSPLLVSYLGPVPDDPTARGRWIEAAGRIAQHHALWDLPDDSLIGPSPPVEERGYEITYYAASRAISELGPRQMSRSLDAERAEQGLSL